MPLQLMLLLKLKLNNLFNGTDSYAVDNISNKIHLLNLKSRMLFTEKQFFQKKMQLIWNMKSRGEICRNDKIRGRERLERQKYIHCERFMVNLTNILWAAFCASGFTLSLLQSVSQIYINKARWLFLSQFWPHLNQASFSEAAGQY